MNRPTAVIAEDEPLLRGELKDALAALWPEVEIKAEAENGIQAIHALETYEPDVLFLDIQMPGTTGLDVARVASGRSHVVFVTAYDDYAVAAFEQGAVDYVMKPFSASRLAMAIARVRARMKGVPADLEGLLKTLAEQSRLQRRFLRWISVGQGKTVRLITTDEICYFQADNKYTIVVTAANQSLINKTIKELVDELDPDVFLQIHRGTVVNVNAIAAVHRDLHGRLEIRLKQRKETLQVSASFAHLFKQM
ncbi:MAG TPA: LytTR family DNA-binding domain-containing protein [Casimicrobiaceae bacterium]|nr:LytTR family DNA-binding domain-containing protein [Casimicrobiaceae bacterium]